MRWFPTAFATVGLSLAAATASARVPSFVRMTGYTRNQCHMTWTHTPDFTFTGQFPDRSFASASNHGCCTAGQMA